MEVRETMGQRRAPGAVFMADMNGRPRHRGEEEAVQPWMAAVTSDMPRSHPRGEPSGETGQFQHLQQQPVANYFGSSARSDGMARMGGQVGPEGHRCCSGSQPAWIIIFNDVWEEGGRNRAGSREDAAVAPQPQQLSSALQHIKQQLEALSHSLPSDGAVSERPPRRETSDVEPFCSSNDCIWQTNSSVRIPMSATEGRPGSFFNLADDHVPVTPAYASLSTNLDAGNVVTGVGLSVASTSQSQHFPNLNNNAMLSSVPGKYFSCPIIVTLYVYK